MVKYVSPRTGGMDVHTLDDTDLTGTAILIGGAADLGKVDRMLKSAGLKVRCVDILDLSDAMANADPGATMLSLAISDRFDCMDVAQIMAYHDFTGRYRILPVGLPRPDILIAESRRHFPSLDIDLLGSPEALVAH